MLMVSGFDKYFQIVRCFRDEDLRADRQYEFTQIDLEMSFPQQETIYETIERMVQQICKVAGVNVELPLPRMTHGEAMRSYGIDKPDLRLPPFHCVEHLFPDDCLLKKPNLPLVAIVIPNTGQVSRKERDELKEIIQPLGVAVYDNVKSVEQKWPEAMEQVRKITNAGPDDLLDAMACSWSAARILRGEGRRFPETPEIDEKGLRMEIWG